MAAISDTGIPVQYGAEITLRELFSKLPTDSFPGSKHIGKAELSNRQTAFSHDAAEIPGVWGYGTSELPVRSHWHFNSGFPRILEGKKQLSVPPSVFTDLGERFHNGQRASRESWWLCMICSRILPAA